jgi:transcriptional regulator of aromatic amino acid metabolism
VTVLIEGERHRREPAASIHALAAPRATSCSTAERSARLPRPSCLGTSAAVYQCSPAAGAFGQGRRGTLCLDEVGELPLDLSSCLGAIETGEIRVGEDGAQGLRRLIAASDQSRSPARSSAAAACADLFYRLSVARPMPSLRQRPEMSRGW